MRNIVDLMCWLVEEKKERNRRERSVFNFRKTKISLYFNLKKKDNMLQYKLKKEG
jgi:hypothetical protein